jgi:glycosyltransferase involved in cell wall biosynthesis
MKVLYLVNSFDPRAGWGRFALELIPRLVERGVDASILAEIGSDYPGEKVILKRSWRAITSSFKVRQLLIKNGFDLIHSLEANPYAITAYLASLGLGKKKIITTTGAYSIQPLYRTRTRQLLKRTYRDAQRILCISQYIKDELSRVVAVDNTEVITLGVDFEKFAGSREIPPEPFIIGVGNLGKRKGYDVSIAAFAEVSKKIPNLKYYIAGKKNPIFLERYQKIVKENGLEDRVIFTGSLNDDELRKLYLSAELFILTSVNYGGRHFEGFGMVFLEAASAGLPVIGTTNNGIADAISEGKNGFLVPQYDVKATADAMLKILTDQQLKDRFSRNSVEWARKNSWDKLIDHYLKVYEEVLRQ